jgi:hypothetical protein
MRQEARARCPDGAGKTKGETMKTKLEPPPTVRKWYSQIGKIGGASKSPAKLAASAKNAKKGGWPKGRPRKVS